MSLTREQVNGMSEIIRRLFLEDSIPWVLGYSGGKDSTATLQLVWMAIAALPLEQRNHKIIHVISTDTLVESPVVSKWVEDSLRHMAEAANQQNMPIIPHRLTPETKDTFWVKLLGRGYPYPRVTMRWCTDRLKIKPANTFVQNMVSTYGEVILLLGTRKAESLNRAKTMQHYEDKRVREYLSPNGSMQNELVFSPLEDWNDDDVWFFLMQYPNPWGYSNKDLLTMYRGATADNECPLVINTDTPSCGKSRFGCWVCTLVEQDKSMEAMIQNDREKEWMAPLLAFRNEIGDVQLDRERRDFRRMSGRAHLFRGRLVHGPYKKSIREDWLKKLLLIQKNINENGPEEFRDVKLISQAELNHIREIWLNEKHEFDDALPAIYQEVMGVPFISSVSSANLSYGKLEWDLLNQVCCEKYPQEQLLFEMTAGILDIEKKAVSMRKRYGLLPTIEKQVKHSFFRDEDDALRYAATSIQRKKAAGIAYDEKADADAVQLEFSEFEELDNED